MFALHRTLSWRYLGRRWFRALLVVCSIALGVAMLVATQALNHSLAKAGQSAVNPLGATCDLQVTNDEAGVSMEVLERLRQAGLPGVRELTPLVIERVGVPAREQDRRVIAEFPIGANGARCTFWHIALRQLPVDDDLGRRVTRIPTNLRMTPEDREALEQAARLLVARGWTALRTTEGAPVPTLPPP